MLSGDGMELLRWSRVVERGRWTGVVEVDIGISPICSNKSTSESSTAAERPPLGLR